MINLKAGFLLLLALALGSMAALMAHGWINEKAASNGSGDAENTIEVLVAAREIPYGKLLEPSLLKKLAWPRESVPKGAILATEDIEGKMVNQAMLPGEMLMRVRVVEKLTGSRLSAIVTPNKRAITVRVNDVAGVAGFLLPGNRVDVLATRMENRRAITHSLLQNLKVLAVDQKASPDKDEPIVVRAVTLESDLEQAAMLASATEEGSIQLVLRNPEDLSTTQAVPQFAAAIEGTEPAAVQETPIKRPVARRRSVTIIRGTEVKKISFRS